MRLRGKEAREYRGMESGDPILQLSWARTHFGRAYILNDKLGVYLPEVGKSRVRFVGSVELLGDSLRRRQKELIEGKAPEELIHLDFNFSDEKPHF